MEIAHQPGVRIQVFTTRPDTVYGMTFAVLAPEHPLVGQITSSDLRTTVEAYQRQALRKTEIERMSTGGERDGVLTGAFAINPANNKPVPVYVADYVLASYGTGAIMGVPAHEQ